MNEIPKDNTIFQNIFGILEYSDLIILMFHDSGIGPLSGLMVKSDTKFPRVLLFL